MGVEVPDERGAVPDVEVAGLVVEHGVEVGDVLEVEVGAALSEDPDEGLVVESLREGGDVDGDVSPVVLGEVAVQALADHGGDGWVECAGGVLLEGCCGVGGHGRSLGPGWVIPAGRRSPHQGRASRGPRLRGVSCGYLGHNGSMDAAVIRAFGGPKSAKFQSLLAAYVGDAQLNLSKAARLAGYARATKQASALKKKYAEVFERADVEYRKTMSVQSQEAEELLAAIARNPKHKDSFNAVKTLLTMHGKLDPTLNVNLKRADLDKALDELITQLAETKAAEEAQENN